MIRRLLPSIALVGLAVRIVQSLPDVARYLAIRKL